MESPGRPAGILDKGISLGPSHCNKHSRINSWRQKTLIAWVCHVCVCVYTTMLEFTGDGSRSRGGDRGETGACEARNEINWILHGALIMIELWWIGNIALLLNASLKSLQLLYVCGKCYFFCFPIHVELINILFINIFHKRFCLIFYIYTWPDHFIWRWWGMATFRFAWLLKWLCQLAVTYLKNSSPSITVNKSDGVCRKKYIDIEKSDNS